MIESSNFLYKKIKNITYNQYHTYSKVSLPKLMQMMEKITRIHDDTQKLGYMIITKRVKRWHIKSIIQTEKTKKRIFVDMVKVAFLWTKTVTQCLWKIVFEWEYEVHCH